MSASLTLSEWAFYGFLGATQKLCCRFQAMDHHKPRGFDLVLETPLPFNLEEGRCSTSADPFPSPSLPHRAQQLSMFGCRGIVRRLLTTALEGPPSLPPISPPAPVLTPSPAIAPAASLGPTTVDAHEVDKFAKLAAAWWRPHGPFWPLHELNPLRTRYVRSAFLSLNRTAGGLADPRLPLAGVRVLDVGCGGGLLSVALARLGATVLGVDATAENVEIARIAASRFRLEDRCLFANKAAENVIASGEPPFDIVCAMEVVEHVSDVPHFISCCSELVRPKGGVFVFSTLNRSFRSWLEGIVLAEHVLGWVPRGTHQWERFVSPEDMARYLSNTGDLQMQNAVGVRFLLPQRAFVLDPADLSVNWMGHASRP